MEVLPSSLVQYHFSFLFYLLADSIFMFSVLVIVQFHLSSKDTINPHVTLLKPKWTQRQVTKTIIQSNFTCCWPKKKKEAYFASQAHFTLGRSNASILGHCLGSRTGACKPPPYKQRSLITILLREERDRGKQRKEEGITALENVEEVRSMAGVLQERVESELAIPGWFRHHRNSYHQVLPRSHWYSAPFSFGLFISLIMPKSLILILK